MRKKSYICSVNAKYVLSVAQASVCNGFVCYSTVNECKGTKTSGKVPNVSVKHFGILPNFNVSSRFSCVYKTKKHYGKLNSVQERLDYLIKIKKMSENAFMKATGTNNIGKMRSGKLSISEGTISKICNSLGVSYSWLKYGSGSMNGNMVIQLGETHQKIEESINEAFKHGIPMAQLINAGNVGDNSQNITTGTERAKEREEESFKDKNAQLIQIINAQNETIKSKDSEIRLLRKILADNGIEV